MNAPKLSKPQEKALRYYRSLADKEPVEFRKALRYKHNPIPEQKLFDLGFLVVVSHLYGGLYGITDAGRAWLSAKDASK